MSLKPYLERLHFNRYFRTLRLALLQWLAFRFHPKMSWACSAMGSLNRDSSSSWSFGLELIASANKQGSLRPKNITTNQNSGQHSRDPSARIVKESADISLPIAQTIMSSREIYKYWQIPVLRLSPSCWLYDDLLPNYIMHLVYSLFCFVSFPRPFCFHERGVGFYS